MKNKLLLLVIGLTMTTMTYAQTPENSVVSVVSQKKDTLYLASTPIGYEIGEVWEIYSEDRPIIIFKSPEWIIRENNIRKKEKEDGTESDN